MSAELAILTAPFISPMSSFFDILFAMFVVVVVFFLVLAFCFSGIACVMRSLMSSSKKAAVCLLTRLARDCFEVIGSSWHFQAVMNEEKYT